MNREYQTAIDDREKYKLEVQRLRIENERMRKAIVDALADLTPGYSPYGLDVHSIHIVRIADLLRDALRCGECRAVSEAGKPTNCPECPMNWRAT